MTAKKKRPTRDRLAFWRKNYLNPRLVRVELDDGLLMMDGSGSTPVFLPMDRRTIRESMKVVTRWVRDSG